MAHKSKVYFVILSIIGSLLIYDAAQAEGRPPSDNAANQQRVAGPEHHEIRLVAFEPWIVGEQIIGTVAAYVYDDVATERAVDYWEIYNQDGALLAVSWFDGHGIRKTAVDRGILDEKDKLEGIFVVVLDGDLV